MSADTSSNQESSSPRPQSLGQASRDSTDRLAEDLARLRADMAKIQETLSKFASQVGGEATRAASSVGHSVVSEIGAAANSFAEAGADLADVAKNQAKTLASELESTARKNPLGTLTAALLAGIVIGMMTRGRN